MKRLMVALSLLALAACGGSIKAPDPTEVIKIICAADPTNPICKAAPPAEPPPVVVPPVVVPPTPPPAPPPVVVPPPSPEPTPEPTPPPVSGFDRGVDDPFPSQVAAVHLAEDGAKPDDIFAADVNFSINVACGGCDAGTLVSDWAQFNKNVRDEMRRRGYKAAYDWLSGDRDPSWPADRAPEVKGLGSELSVWQGGHLESYQVLTSARKVRRPVGAFRARGVVVGACPIQLPLPVGYSLELRVERYAGQQFESTPYLKRGDAPFPPPKWTGACRPAQCDLAEEKDRLNGGACTVDLCGEHVDYRIEPADSALLNWAEGYKVKITPARTGVLVGTCPKAAEAEGRVTF